MQLGLDIVFCWGFCRIDSYVIEKFEIDRISPDVQVWARIVRLKIQ